MGGERRVRVEPVNRKQTVLRAVDVEKLIEERHGARAIWELVGRLDLSSFYARIEAEEGEAGRPAFDPQVMISLWTYAYSQGVSSAREVSRLCGQDPAYQWLTGMREINHHSLSDFRVAHKQELEDLFIQLLGVLSADGLITLERVMQDGTKIKACASGRTFRREEKVRAHLDLAREQVKLMTEAGGEEVAPRLAQARLRVLREKETRLEQALREIEKLRADKKGEDRKKVRVSVTDPEARVMKQSDGGFAPSYNAQLTTDAAHGLIVGVGVTQARTDYGELVGAMERVEENLGRLPDQGVVDGGYVSHENILSMQEIGVDLIGPAGDRKEQTAEQMVQRGVASEFQAEAFFYHAEENTYTCPMGKTLSPDGREKAPGVTSHVYRARSADCRQCSEKAKCCTGKIIKGRSIRRTEVDPVIVRWKEKMETDEAKAIYRQRAQVAEFPHAWIKEKIRLRQFRLRGLLKVGIEVLWACLTYNVQQWVRLCWRAETST